MSARGPALLAVGLVAVATSGCGSNGKSAATPTPSTASQPPTTATTTPGPAARLRITYFPHGSASAARTTWTLTCAPPGGNHPRPAVACAELAGKPHALDPPHRPCPLALVRGSPQALVSGTYRGVAIDRMLRPACDPGWTSLHALLSGR